VTGRIDVREGLRGAVFHEEFRQDLSWWSSQNPKIAARVDSLANSILEDSAEARELGQPLRHALSGCYTRRLIAEHRLVYRCAPDAVHFLQCRYHA